MSQSFTFTPENRHKLEQILKSYPDQRAAMLPTLYLAQQQLGYVSMDAEHHVAEVLEVPVADVHEVMTFYTLFFRESPGRHHIRLCTSLSCWIRGCEKIQDHLERKLGVPEGERTADARVSWEAVPDCLGACEAAPMMQFDGSYYGNLTPERVDRLLEPVRK